MSVAATTATQQARLDGTSKKKPSKAEKQAAMKAMVPAPKEQDQKSVPAPKEQDQKSAPEPKAKDQKSAKKKKASVTLVNYLAHKKAHKLGMEQKIRLLTAPGACPKTRGAAIKFKKYKEGKDGMTVQQYIDVLHKDLGKTPRQTMDDIHWDFVSGFISLDGKSFAR